MAPVVAVTVMLEDVVLRRDSDTGLDWFLAGYAGVGGFFALEATMRQRGSAASLKSSSNDQRTTRKIIAAYTVASALAPLLRRTALPQLPTSAGPAGLALQITGLALRAWAMRTLGSHYSRTLRTEEDHQVIDTGPYRLVRHPGYSGSLLTWTGFALSSHSLPVVAVVTGLLGRAYRRRITAEEQLLNRELLGYATYTKRTKKLIPLVW
jgi:protein-S-isoprenylcysteine O-methyltransferase Ste14